MSENKPSIRDAIQGLGEATAMSGIGITRYRDFLGNRVAQRFMGRVGLHLAGDDVGNAALAELLGTGVTNGIVLGMRGTTTYEDVDETVAGLLEQLPTELRESVGALMPHLVEEGITFHRDELVPGSDEVSSWEAEFWQLQAADPTHANWSDELAGEQPR